MEDIPESLISKRTGNVKKKTTYQQPSYWKYVYGLVGEVVEEDLREDVYEFCRLCLLFPGCNVLCVSL